MREHPSRPSGATDTFERYAAEFAALAVHAHADGVDIEDMIAVGRARAGQTLIGCDVAVPRAHENVRGGGSAAADDRSA